MNFGLIFSFILMVPFDSDELKGIVYVWVGKRADHKEAQIAEEIAYMMYKVGQHHAILIILLISYILFIHFEF